MKLVVDFILRLIFQRIKIIPMDNYKTHIKESEELISDKKDSPFLALALSLGNCKIWSDDKDFEKQNRIEILKTGLAKEYFKKGKENNLELL